MVILHWHFTVIVWLIFPTVEYYEFLSSFGFNLLILNAEDKAEVQEQGPFQARLVQNWKEQWEVQHRSVVSELLLCVFNQKDQSHTSAPKLLPLPELAGRLPPLLNSLQH